MIVTIVERSGKIRHVECESFEFRFDEITNAIKIKGKHGGEAILFNVHSIKVKDEATV